MSYEFTSSPKEAHKTINNGGIMKGTEKQIAWAKKIIEKNITGNSVIAQKIRDIDNAKFWIEFRYFAEGIVKRVEFLADEFACEPSDKEIRKAKIMKKRLASARKRTLEFVQTGDVQLVLKAAGITSRDIESVIDSLPFTMAASRFAGDWAAIVVYVIISKR